MLFLVLAVILCVLCVAAGQFVQRNRELARYAPLRDEIQAQVCFETALGLGRTCILRRGGLAAPRGYWQTVTGQARLTVGAHAFMLFAPRALSEYAFTGCETSIALTQMRSGPAGREWIVITGPSDGRQVQLAIMPDNLPGTWNALLGTGAALVPLVEAMPHDSRMSRWLGRRRPWQFALIWWAGTMACILVVPAAVAVWRGSDVHEVWLFNAVVLSTASTVLTVRHRQRRTGA
jgi:hypothetical protein